MTALFFLYAVFCYVDYSGTKGIPGCFMYIVNVQFSEYILFVSNNGMYA